jgi:hypothetical protein
MLRLRGMIVKELKKLWTPSPINKRGELRV